MATKIGDSIRWWRVVAAAAGLGGLFLSILAGTMTAADQSGPRMALTTVWADVLWVLLLAQAIHALTFAAHHTACIALLSHHFPGRLRGRGQALYASLGYGVPGVLGALGGGALSDALGLSAVYAVSVGTACVACLCAWQFKRSN